MVFGPPGATAASPPTLSQGEGEICLGLGEFHLHLRLLVVVHELDLFPPDIGYALMIMNKPDTPSRRSRTA